MKTNLLTIFGLMALTLVFSSCKKDKDDPKNYFTYQEKTYETNHAQNTDEGGYSSVVFASFDASQAGTSGKISAINIGFDNTVVTPGTYSFKEGDDPDFDGTKNFFDAVAVIDLTYQNGVPDLSSGTVLEEITAGTITIGKDGSNYNVSYELNFNGKNVSGKYSGAIE